MDSQNSISLDESDNASNEISVSETQQMDILLRSRNAPKQLIIPKHQHIFARPFEEKFRQGLFLGSPSQQRDSIQSEQYRRVRFAALSLFNKGPTFLEPNEPALLRTKKAVKYFFKTAHKLLTEKMQLFPLANANKCLGMVAVPNSRLVMIAISQHKEPQKDEALRKEMVVLLEAINLESNTWKFELACVPTPSQYLIPRTLMDIQHPASKKDIDPHTRCVEVSLMVALNKIGRLKHFTPEEMGVMAFGGALWADPEDDKAMDYFGDANRNKKYVEQNPLQIDLANGASAWVDIWEPCSGHCEIYKYEMAAVAGAGGPATSFAEPCFESSMTLKNGL